MQVIWWQILSDTPMCEHCTYWLILLKVLVIAFYLFKHTTFRDVLCQTIQNIIDCDQISDFDLLLYGACSPDEIK